MTNILLLFLLLSLNSFASADCASVDLNQLSDDKISEYTHCFKGVEVTITEPIKAKSKLKFIPVCDRSEPVKLKLEEIFKNTCDQITKDILFAYDGEFEMLVGKYRKPKLGDFSGMNNLKYLDLYDNSIEALPTGIFDDLENLIVLSISDNKIEKLSINTFKRLFKLSILLLDKNTLKTLPMGIFDSLINLDSLYLDGNQIEEVPKNIFDKLSKLSRLDLQHNNIKVLSRPIFSTPENSLESLYLHANPLTHIYNPAFKNLSKLKLLDLGSTNLSIIGKKVFTPLENLQTLALAGIKTNNNMIGQQTNESTILFKDLSVEQFTQLLPFPLNRVEIYDSESLIRNHNFINELKEKGVNVVE